MPPSSVAVFGLGYVGCVTAACLAETGHDVTGVDRDDHKVRNVSQSHAPFYEPGLKEIVKSNVAAGRLRACRSAGSRRCGAHLRRHAFGT